MFLEERVHRDQNCRNSILVNENGVPGVFTRCRSEIAAFELMMAPSHGHGLPGQHFLVSTASYLVLTLDMPVAEALLHRC